jgi:hypothetical protein
VVSPRGPQAGWDLTREGVQPPSEAEPHPRGRPALERGGTSPEGATDPRARRNLARGGVQPSSETEICQCSVVPLERSGVPLEGGWADCLVGCWGHQGRGPVSLSYTCFRFVFVLFYVKVSGFHWLFRGPLWPSPTVAPEHLRVYPLGPRRCRRLLMALSSFLVACSISWGRASRPAGLAPDAL